MQLSVSEPEVAASRRRLARPGVGPAQLVDEHSWVERPGVSPPRSL